MQREVNLALYEALPEKLNVTFSTTLIIVLFQPHIPIGSPLSKKFGGNRNMHRADKFTKPLTQAVE